MVSMLSMQQIFDHVLEMPSISRVVQELIESFNDPRTNVDAIARKLRMDQALSAKVLRMANSARYGAGRQVTSIDSAVITLGFDAVRTLVVASGVTGAFRRVPHLDMNAYWRETFLVASVSKAIAQHARLDAETAFTCGLMHSVGELLLYLSDGETMSRIGRMAREGADQVQLERNQFGFDYAEVGEELARRWHFPERITQAVGQHTHVLERLQPEPYALILYLARYLALGSLGGVSRQEILAHFPAELAEPLDLDMLGLMEEMDRLLAEEDDIDQVLAA